VPYTQLTPEDTKKMSDAVDALGEPVSQVAGVVTS
jgi:iron uptake system component EfeO